MHSMHVRKGALMYAHTVQKIKTVGQNLWFLKSVYESQALLAGSLVETFFSASGKGLSPCLSGSSSSRLWMVRPVAGIFWVSSCEKIC